MALRINDFGGVPAIGIRPHLHHPRRSCVEIVRVSRPIDLVPGWHLAAWQIADFSSDRPATPEVTRIVHGLAGIRQQLGVTTHGNGKICAPPLPPAPVACPRLDAGEVVQDSVQPSNDWIGFGQPISLLRVAGHIVRHNILQYMGPRPGHMT